MGKLFPCVFERSVALFGDTPLLQSMAVDGGLGERIVPALERAVPMRRIGLPEDYPGIVAFLASDDAAFITGQTISVSGGLTMA